MRRLIGSVAVGLALVACSDGPSGPEPPEGFVYSAVAAGGQHSCGLAPGDAVYCWGRGNQWALGDGTGQSSPVPVRTRVTGTVLEVSAGIAHSCALTDDASVRCWGWNRYGQIGVGDNSDHGYPVTLTFPGSGGIATISAGWFHTCALDQLGQAYCWGGNAQGQLGDGTRADSNRPVPVATDERFASISAGADHTCAVTLGGGALCWGLNHRGQLGTGHAEGALVPAPVVGGHSFRSVSAGFDHSCGVRTDQAVLCWGSNESGQLGNGGLSGPGQPGSVSPHRILRPDAAMSVSAGYGFTCAVSTAHHAWCWGRGEAHQLGLGRFDDFTVPQRILDRDISFATVSARGLTHACAVSRHGAAYCWGTGQHGQLGAANVRISPVPVRVSEGVTR